MSRVLPVKTTLSCEANARRSSHRGLAPSLGGNRRREKETSALIRSPGGPRRHPRYRGVYEGACACVCTCMRDCTRRIYLPSGGSRFFFFFFFENGWRLRGDILCLLSHWLHTYYSVNIAANLEIVNHAAVATLSRHLRDTIASTGQVTLPSHYLPSHSSHPCASSY